ncbi:DUF4232 domain-containing protein [Streptomyces pluripotens]|uniref:DUF4232 domain-containing protein n=1 Tax=Streptomyces pluripotens TaxID=1355015 RepID=A0A221NSZ1_9ACTN|nr:MULTISPECIES: DUF4232 domain-containing protein [Streptomyces]ARP68776.1 hypothetical protein LK06_001125 [Streptomyces pluripotens]ASN23032.1 DUF4232 domain-containing protein [Streptomyces pluripotens]KIE27828.1 hypothetical protein LK08_06165 [Streptomyces sp. MUSC 125]MCH0558491.1 DUF4232 domain-containing protein [Streptomyces sp. MUM 16J]
MAYTPRSARHGALLVGTVAVLGLLTACGNGNGAQTSPPVTASGTAAPAADDTTSPASGTTSAGASPPTSTPVGTTTATASAPGTTTSSGSDTPTTSANSRCHTSELRAAVGRNDPGAGQENFPVVLTNKSARTCTVHGYPGLAFVNASGTQLGPDPERESGSPTTITLKPGQSAWAGLTFSNPEISGASTATPTALLVTPPDERDHLQVAWAGGAVPVSGNSSSVFLTVLRPGTGP